MVVGAVWALCEFSLLVSEQNHFDLSLAAQDDELKRFLKKKGAFREQKMSKSVKTKVDELLERESHHLQVQKIHKIHATMEGQLYGAQKVTTSKRRKYQVRLNRARHSVTIWADADRQRAIERLECEILPMTYTKRKLFDKWIWHHECQLLQEAGTEATGPRSIFTKNHAQMKTAVGEEAYGAVNMTTNNRVQFQICLSDAGIVATTWSITDTDCVVNQLGREIYGITLKDQVRFTKKSSIHLVEFKAW